MTNEKRTGKEGDLQTEVGTLDDMVSGAMSVGRVANEAKGLSKLANEMVEGFFIRTAGPEWVENLRRRETARTRIAEAHAAQQEAQAANQAADAANRVRAGQSADSRQREKELNAEKAREAFEAQKAARLQADRLAAVELDERETVLAERKIIQEQEEFRLRMCHDVADFVVGALHRLQREGRLLDLTPAQIGALIDESSQRAIRAVEDAVTFRMMPMPSHQTGYGTSNSHTLS